MRPRNGDATDVTKVPVLQIQNYASVLLNGSNGGGGVGQRLPLRLKDFFIFMMH